MGVRFRNRTIDGVTKTVDESTSQTLEVPRDARIQALTLCANIAVANATTTLTMTKRQLASIFTKIELIENGSTGRVSVDGARLYDMDYYMMGCEPVVWDVNANTTLGGTVSIAGSSTENVYIELPLLFRVNPKDDQDVAGLVNAYQMSSLDLSVTMGSAWRPASANLTITGGSSSMFVKVREVLGTDKEIMALANAKGFGNLWDVYYTSQQATLTTSANMLNSVDLETQALHQQIGMHQYDLSATDWVNDIVDRFKFQVTDQTGDVMLAEQTWEASVGDDLVTYGVPQAKDGFTIYDPEADVLGLNTFWMKKGDFRVYYNTGGTVSSGNDLLQFTYKSLRPSQVQ